MSAAYFYIIAGSAVFTLAAILADTLENLIW